MADEHDHLRAAREAVVREHMDAEYRLDWDATLATFDHSHYELMAPGRSSTA